MSTVVAFTFSPSELYRNAIKSLVALALFIGLVSVAHCGSGCASWIPGAPELDAAYRADLVGCSVGAKTLPEAKACRKAVNTRYGLCEHAEWPRISPCDD